MTEPFIGSAGTWRFTTSIAARPSFCSPRPGSSSRRSTATTTGTPPARGRPSLSSSRSAGSAARDASGAGRDGPFDPRRDRDRWDGRTRPARRRRDRPRTHRGGRCGSREGRGAHHRREGPRRRARVHRHPLALGRGDVRQRRARERIAHGGDARRVRELRGIVGAGERSRRGRARPRAFASQSPTDLVVVWRVRRRGGRGQAGDQCVLVRRPRHAPVVRHGGVRSRADQYPYTASSTGLAVTIPNWVHEGGTAKMCERLRDPAVRARIRSEEVETGRAFDRIVIARARLHPEWAGKSVQQLADAAGRDPLEWSCDALIEHDGAVDIVHHSMSEDDVRLVMAKEWICIGSDSRANAPYGPLSFGKPHPRSYGTFPRVLGRYARDEKVLRLEDAVRKMTSLTASRPRVHDRGVVREGAWADLVVFDPARVIDAATYDDPHQYPVGLDYVIVNGGVALEHGETTPERRGRFLRQGRDLGGR